MASMERRNTSIEARSSSRGGSSDKRRAQVRQAQKAYHARKKAAHDSLETRVHMLEATVQGMCDNFLQLNDNLLASASCRREPALMKMVEASLQRTLALTADVFDGPAAIEGPADHQQAEPHTSPTATDDAVQGIPSSNALPTANVPEPSVLGTTFEPIFAGPFPSLMWQPTQYDLILQHPMAPQLFPAKQHWSPFANKLYMEALRLGWLALTGVAEQSLAESTRMFQYTLVHSSREHLLRGLRVIINFENVGPAFSDGTVVLQRRQLHQHGFPLEASDLDAMEQSKEYIYAMLDRVQHLSGRVDQFFNKHQWATVEYLKPGDIEDYLRSIGVEILDDVSVQLPLKTKEAPSKPRGVRTLPRQLEPRGLSSTRTTNRPTVHPTTSFNPLQWHSPEVVFPSTPSLVHEDVSPSDEIPWDLDAAQWLQEVWPTSPKMPSKVHIDSLIRELSMQSTCDGTGPGFKLENIHTAVNNLVLSTA